MGDDMKRMWAPWRMKYILQPEQEGCLFCEKSKVRNDRKHYVLYRSDRSFCIMNLYPYNNGHLMVAPYRHVRSLESLTDEEICDMLLVAKKGVKALKKAFKPQGFNMGINIGRIAGAGVVGHLHMHIVPRWKGDTNFMPILSDTKLVSQGLNKTYDTLKEHIKMSNREGC
jgi:ATP adenylyltransferase